MLALHASAPITSLADAFGWPARYNAAAPATCGEAIDVPLAVAVPPPRKSERIRSPGAKRSTHGPQFENSARASVCVLAPTTMARPSSPGEERHASSRLLPAATV